MSLPVVSPPPLEEGRRQKKKRPSRQEIKARDRHRTGRAADCMGAVQVMTSAPADEEDAPAWLREAALLPHSTADSLDDVAAKEEGGGKSPVSWGAVHRILEEKTALEAELREAFAVRAAIAAHLEDSRTGLASETKRCEALEQDKAELTRKLDRADARIEAVHADRLEAQARILELETRESELLLRLDLERTECHAKVRETKAEAEGAVAAMAEEGQAQKDALAQELRITRAEKAALLEDLTRARFTLVAGTGLGGAAASLVFAQPRETISPPEMPPVDAAKPLGGLGKQRTAKPAGLSTRPVNNATETSPRTASKKALATRSTGGSASGLTMRTTQDLDHELKRIEAALQDKENELSLCGVDRDDLALVQQMIS